MFESIRIINFESHKDTLIEFGEKVNAIVGMSHCGKSSVVKAFRWVFENKPAGDFFRSHWGGDTSVILTLSDGTTVSRVKTNSENYYAYQKQGQEEVVLRAMGRSVPESISAILNINEINTQYQFDTHFLLSDSGGEVSRFFNEMANLSTIDETFSRCNGAIIKQKAEVRRLEKTKEEKEERIKELQPLFLPAKRALVLESKVQALEDEKEALVSLSGAVERIDKLTAQLSSLPDINTKGLDEALHRHQNLKQMEDDCDNLSIVIQKIERQKTALSEIPASVGTLLPQIDILQKEFQDIVSDCSTKDLRDKIQLLEVQVSILKRTEAELKEAEQSYKEEMPDVCPLCGSNVKEKK
jgi:chromosome segregation ATPase